MALTWLEAKDWAVTTCCTCASQLLRVRYIFFVLFERKLIKDHQIPKMKIRFRFKNRHKRKTSWNMICLIVLRRPSSNQSHYLLRYKSRGEISLLHCKYIQWKDSGSAVKPLCFWKNTVVYHRPCFTVFFTSKNCNFSIILHVV